MVNEDLQMVEQVAKALFATEWANKGHSWEMEADHQEYWRTAARAAIAAMRQPTEAMTQAAYEAASLDDRWCIEDADHWVKAWAAAVDAAAGGGET